MQQGHRRGLPNTSKLKVFLSYNRGTPKLSNRKYFYFTTGALPNTIKVFWPYNRHRWALHQTQYFYFTTALSNLKYFLLYNRSAPKYCQTWSIFTLQYGRSQILKPEVFLLYNRDAPKHCQTWSIFTLQQGRSQTLSNLKYFYFTTRAPLALSNKVFKNGVTTGHSNFQCSHHQTWSTQQWSHNQAFPDIIKQTIQTKMLKKKTRLKLLTGQQKTCAMFQGKSLFQARNNMKYSQTLTKNIQQRSHCWGLPDTTKHKGFWLY